ncbi:MAG: hypothetical protein WAL84_04235 [Candidatus Dormiibacterota bacterium]
MVTTSLTAALGFASSCAHGVLVALHVASDHHVAPARDDLAAVIEGVLARRSVVTLAERYGGRPWLAIVAGDAVVAGRGTAMWSSEDVISERVAPAYEPAALPPRVDDAVRALAQRLDCDLFDVRLIELPDEDRWLCYSAGAWPRLAAAPWAASCVADHLLAFLHDRGARW